MEGDVLPQVRRSTGFLCDVLRDQGPFDGIVGFSQGAAMTALFLGLLQNQNSKWLSSSAPQLHNLLVERKAADLVWPRFVLLFCGFNPFVQAIERLVSFDGKIPIPNFHMGGRKDTVTPMYRGRQLATSYFGKPTIEFHEGGHGIPTTGPFIQMYQDFIRNAMKRSVHFSKARDNKGDKGGHHDAAAARHQLSVESD
ncbi:Ovarian cancer-associated protein 2 [Coemansia spiralis]|nr:Ovarian cancer-associated protein 2 [Coemansia spiralis]